jgi:uncharacterized membrane protein YoaK (UPF0700 family)
MSWDRRYAFLLGLTGAAGALDALSFMFLGKVFTSFQSGNVLFVGIAAGDLEGGLLIRAGTALLMFLAGAAAGAHLVGRRLLPRAMRKELRVVAIEAALLTVFAAVWIVIGTPAGHPVVRVVLLAIAGFAMGIQAALVLALKIPNVVTVALTATVAYIGQRAGADAEPKPRRADVPGTGLLAALILTYVVCAVVVAVLPEGRALSLAPLVVLAGGVALDMLHHGLPARGHRRPIAAQGR